MRNPLTAIIQSADAIINSMSKFQEPLISREASAHLLASAQESAEIILLCAQHQGRMINDTLTLSKLDSGMLSVAPVPVQPSRSVQTTVKMFQGEAASHDMKLDFVIEETYHVLQIDWVQADPSRFGQVSKTCNLAVSVLIGWSDLDQSLDKCQTPKHQNLVYHFDHLLGYQIHKIRTCARNYCDPRCINRAPRR